MSDYEEIEEEERLEGGIKTSGERRDFGTGAHRDSNIKVHKGRMDLIPSVALNRFATYLESTGFTPATFEERHSLYFYNSAMDSMYQWMEGVRIELPHWDFDHLSNALWHGMQLMQIADDLPLWIPTTSPDYSFRGSLAPRYDKISPLLLRRVSIHYQLGGINYGDRNWEKGMPVMVTWDSATRHLVNWLEKEETEDHLAAFAWNVMCTMHTIEMVKRGMLPEHLDDSPPTYHNIKTGITSEELFADEDNEEDF